jgi:hypothetical protein
MPNIKKTITVSGISIISFVGSATFMLRRSLLRKPPGQLRLLLNQEN